MRSVIVLGLCILIGIATAQTFLYTEFPDQMVSAYQNRKNTFAINNYNDPNAIVIGYGDSDDNLILQRYSNKPYTFPPQPVDPPTPLYQDLKHPSGSGTVVGVSFLKDKVFIASSVAGGMTALVSGYNTTSNKMEPLAFSVFTWNLTEIQNGTPFNISITATFLSAIVMNDYTSDLRVAVLARFVSAYKVIVFGFDATGPNITSVTELPGNVGGQPDIIPFPATDRKTLQTFFVACPYQISLANWGISTFRTTSQYQLVDQYNIDTINARSAFRLKLTEIPPSGEYWMLTGMYLTDQGLVISQGIKQESNKATVFSQQLASLPGIVFTPFATRTLPGGTIVTTWIVKDDNSKIYGTGIKITGDDPVFNFTIPAATPTDIISELIISPLENYTFALTQVVRDRTAPSGFINYYALSNCNDSSITPNENCASGQAGCVKCTCDEKSGWYPFDGTSCITSCEDGITVGNETCFDGNDKNCKNCQCVEGFAIKSIDSVCKSTETGFNKAYIAAIILCPVGAGLIIFLAVFFGKKKQQEKKKKKDEDNNDNKPKDDVPMIAVTGTYSTVPSVDGEVRTNDNKYGAIRRASLTDTSADKTADKLKVPYADLKFVKEIGSGAYGKVFVGEWQRTKVALKINTLASGDEFAREAKLMVDLRPHPNVVQMLGVSSDGPYPVMILEFCDGGSLDTKLFHDSQVTTLNEQLVMISGIAKGLYHLHKNQIVHRDLAARNILLNFNQPKISDFGLSRFVNDTQKGTTRSNVGPIRWMAPESLKNQTYSTKSDVWSFGVVVYEIVAHKEPHAEADQMAIGLQIRDNGTTPEIPSDCDPCLSELLNKCWQLDPALRPTMEEICDMIDNYMQEENIE